MSRETDRHLIFGLLALQNGLVDHDQLLAAFRAWTRDKSRSIADHLAALGHLDDRRRAAIEAMVALHIEDHDGDPSKSLAALGAGPSTVERLAGIADTDLHDSLATVAPGLDDPDPYPTVSRVIGDSTTHGRRFRFLRPHAHGGLGEVSVALDAELNREVALKEILARHADNPVSRSKFLLEAEITGGLEHPGIVPVYGLGTYADGRPYYAMRFIRGDTLKQAIASFHEDTSLQADPGKRSLALRRLLRRFADVCNAVEYAHSRGVLHRDLKPANVILGRHGETLVVDWGLAKATGHVDPRHDSPEPTLNPSASGDSSTETLPGQAVGTPAYMSPEQAAGRLDLIGPRSDVYGLGATLYHLLTNQPPGTGTDLATIYQSIERGDFPRPRELSPSIDPAIEAIALKAMALDPANRYPSARALADDLERWTADEPVQAWPEPFTIRARRWMRRHRVLVTAATAALLVAAIGLGVVSAVQARANRDLTQANKSKDRANTDLLAAIERETVANHEAKLSSELAEARFDLAQDAIKTFTAGVQEDDLLKNENLKPLRDKLLRSAVGFYEKLEKRLQAQADEKSRATLAASYMELGNLIDRIGIRSEALTAYRKALSIRQELVGNPEAVDRTRDELAKTLIEVGRLEAATGEIAGGIEEVTKARKILDLLVKANPSVTRYQADLAASHNNIGSLLSQRGDTAGAMRSHRNAANILSRLTSANPSVADYKSGLADSYSSEGFELSQLGDTTGAIRSYREALNVLLGLTKDNPTVTRYQADLASSQYEIGFMLSVTGNAAESLHAFREALNIRASLAQANPSVTRYQSDLAASHNSIGGVLRRTDAAEALRSYFEARNILSRLAQVNPSVIRYQTELASIHNNIGATLVATDPAGAVNSYREAIEILSRHAQANPSVVRSQAVLATIHNNVGYLLAQTDDTTGALRSYSEAVLIWNKLASKYPDIPEHRSNLAASLFGLGLVQFRQEKPAEAITTFRQSATLREGLPLTSGNLLEATKVKSRLVEAGRMSGSGMSAEKLRREADAAVASLAAAIRAGCRDLADFKTNPAFAPIRDRPDVQLMLMDLAFPAKPFAEAR